jgi:hypothetical protein
MVQRYKKCCTILFINPSAFVEKHTTAVKELLRPHLLTTNKIVPITKTKG